MANIQITVLLPEEVADKYEAAGVKLYKTRAEYIRDVLISLSIQHKCAVPNTSTSSHSGVGRPASKPKKKPKLPSYLKEPMLPMKLLEDNWHYVIFYPGQFDRPAETLNIMPTDELMARFDAGEFAERADVEDLLNHPGIGPYEVQEFMKVRDEYFTWKKNHDQWRQRYDRWLAENGEDDE